MTDVQRFHLRRGERLAWTAVRPLRILLFAVVSLILSACQIDAVVDVTVEEDGSGTVVLTTTFDENVIANAPELSDSLQTNDLAAAGWDIEELVDTPQSLVVRATKDFATADDLNGVLGEIAGPNTLFSDFTVERTRSFARTTYEVTGVVDPLIPLTTFGDDTVTGLVGSPLGLSVSELEAIAGRPLSETVTLDFSITLPATVQANTTDADGAVATWSLTPQDRLATDIEVSASIEDQLPRIWAAVALVALGVLFTLVIFNILARFSGRRVDDRGEEVVQMRRPEKIAAEPVAAARERPPKLELVVIDARGVLYDESNDVGARLIPFARERGSKASLQEINDAFRVASLGRLSSAELWAQLGLTDDPKELDEAYAEEFQLRDGVLDFLDRLHDRGLRVAVVANNVLGWSILLRKKYELGERVDMFVVSGDIGARMPEPAFFEALRRMTKVEYSDSLLIDDQIDDLDMARSLGMSTAMFVAQENQLPASSPHPIVHGFDSFFGRS